MFKSNVSSIFIPLISITSIRSLTYSLSPHQIIVFILMGFAFKSLFIPIRGVTSIALTLGLVFGLLTFVYQDGALAGLHFSGQSINLSMSYLLTSAGLGNEGAIVWIAPILGFFLITGAASIDKMKSLTQLQGCRRTTTSS